MGVGGGNTVIAHVVRLQLGILVDLHGVILAFAVVVAVVLCVGDFFVRVDEDWNGGVEAVAWAAGVGGVGVEHFVVC